MTLGATVGLGLSGFFITNARDVTDLVGSGPWLNFNLNIPIVWIAGIELTLGVDPSTGYWMFTVLPTIGLGGSFSIYPSNTSQLWNLGIL
jgi:hypothetical protein